MSAATPPLQGYADVQDPRELHVVGGDRRRGPVSGFAEDKAILDGP